MAKIDSQELLRRIEREKAKREIRHILGIKHATKPPAIYGTINRRIAEFYGIELAKDSVIQYR